jgi:phosphoglycolate phosphatase
MLLATSKPQLHAERIVRHFKLDAWLSGVYGASFDDTHADKTALLGNLLLKERLDPARCLMAGDRKHDVNGARANRIPVCGVLWGYGGEVELREAGADFLADSPAALLALVRERVALAR